MMEFPRSQRTKPAHDELIRSIRPRTHDVAALGHFLPEWTLTLAELFTEKH